MLGFFVFLCVFPPSQQPSNRARKKFLAILYRGGNWDTGIGWCSASKGRWEKLTVVKALCRCLQPRRLMFAISACTESWVVRTRATLELKGKRWDRGWLGEVVIMCLISVSLSGSNKGSFVVRHLVLKRIPKEKKMYSPKILCMMAMLDQVCITCSR